MVLCNHAPIIYNKVYRGVSAKLLNAHCAKEGDIKLILSLALPTNTPLFMRPNTSACHILPHRLGPQYCPMKQTLPKPSEM